MKEADSTSEDGSFGKFVQSTVHNNLSLKLQTADIKLCSLLISLNSPEFDQIFGNSSPTVNGKDIDCCGDDSPLTKIGVNVFKRALCLGRIDLNSESFKDVYKLAYLFRVPWIAAECLQYLSQNNSHGQLSMNAFDSELLKLIGDSNSHPIPCIDLPFNFGVEKLNMSLHNNVEIRLKDGEKMFANSVILALNSPLFDDFFSKRQLSVHQMKDFEQVNVRQFITSLYSGDTELSKVNLREICKLCHVFKVHWMICKCDHYLRELLQSTGWQDFEGLLFILEEAVFLRRKFKRQEFIDSFIMKLNKIKIGFTVFVRPYMEQIGYSSLSEDQIRLICQICKSDATLLLDYVRETIISNGCALDDVSIQFVRNMDISCTVNCKLPDVLLQLNDLLSKDLENVSINDIKSLTAQCKEFNQTISLDAPEQNCTKNQEIDAVNDTSSATSPDSLSTIHDNHVDSKSLIQHPIVLESCGNEKVKNPSERYLYSEPTGSPDASKSKSETLSAEKVNSNQSKLKNPTSRKSSVSDSVCTPKRRSQKRSPDVHGPDNDSPMFKKPSKNLLNSAEASTSKPNDKFISKRVQSHNVNVNQMNHQLSDKPRNGQSPSEKKLGNKPLTKSNSSENKPAGKKFAVQQNSIHRTSVPSPEESKAVLSHQKNFINGPKTVKQVTNKAEINNGSNPVKLSPFKPSVNLSDGNLLLPVNSTDQCKAVNACSAPSSTEKSNSISSRGNATKVSKKPAALRDQPLEFGHSSAWKRRYESDDDDMIRRKGRLKRFNHDREKSMMLHDKESRKSGRRSSQTSGKASIFDKIPQPKSRSDGIRNGSSEILKMVPANRMSKTAHSNELSRKSTYIRNKIGQISPTSISNYLSEVTVPPKSLDDLYESPSIVSSYMLHEGLLLLKQKKKLPEGFSTSDFEMIEKITDWNEWAHVSPKFTCVYKSFALFLKGLAQIDIDHCCSELGSMNLFASVFGTTDPYEIVDFVSTERTMIFHACQCIQAIVDITPIKTGCDCKPNHFDIGIYKTASKNITGRDLHVVLESQTGDKTWKQHTISFQGKPYICNNRQFVKWGIHRIKAGTKVRLVFFWNNTRSPYEVISREERTKVSNVCLCDRCVEASVWKRTVCWLIGCSAVLTEWVKQEGSPLIIGRTRNLINIMLLIIFVIIILMYYYN